MSAPPSIPIKSAPELLAPAGDWTCARAAVENGADAIYFGLDRFNARMRAENFTLAELPKLMQFLHERGVRGYVTFNTLVFTEELIDAEDYLMKLIGCGVDAAIVQDVGICRLIRKISPDFPINASTQMSITSAEGIRFSEALGAYITALGRECSLDEIEKIQHDRLEKKPDADSLPLEVFVHGALCVSCSGQCLASEALGKRSANRGECAQPCRLPYQLICDGEPLNLKGRHFLLSPTDVAGLELLQRFIRAGVTCLKIEGRLKSPEYVASVCRIYRKAIDSAMNLSRCPSVSERDFYEMEMTFSRGLGTGWLNGIDLQKVSHGRFSNNHGYKLGHVADIERDTVWIRSSAPIKPGDGIVFDDGKSDKILQGGYVYHVSRDGEFWGLEFNRESFDMSQIRPRYQVYKTSDPELYRRLSQSFTSEKILYHRPIHAEITGGVGIPLSVTFSDGCGHRAMAVSEMPLQQAQKVPLTQEKLKEQLGRLGDSPFFLKSLSVSLDGDCIIPVSELNKMRRSLVSRLLEARSTPLRWKLNPAVSVREELKRIAGTRSPRTNETSRLAVMVRNRQQFEIAIDGNCDEVYCDFDVLREYKSLRNKEKIWVCPPRIFKPGETPYLTLTTEAGARGIIVRNYDHLEFFKGLPCRADYSLNITNPLSAEYFIEKWNPESLTLSYDLNILQIQSLLACSDPARFEMNIHQHLPMFHTQLCSFCAYLTGEKGFPYCQKACEKHTLALRDRTGLDHPILPDAVCRNTIFNARIQTACDYITELQAMGLRRFRIEFVNETPEQVAATIRIYHELLAGTIGPQTAWDQLKGLGFALTRGSLQVNEER